MPDWIPLVFLAALFALTVLSIEGANHMRGRARGGGSRTAGGSP